MKAVPRSVAYKDAVQSHKASVNFSDNYGVACKKNSIFNDTRVKAIKFASLLQLAPITSSHTGVILWRKLR